MILIVHNVSDCSLSIGRFFSEAHLPGIKNKVTEAAMAVQVCFFWVFFRLAVYPACMIKSIYTYIPTPEQEWHFIYWEYMVLFIFTNVLVIMHAYWFIFLAKSIYVFITKKELHNHFDNKQGQD